MVQGNHGLLPLRFSAMRPYLLKGPAKLVTALSLFLSGVACRGGDPPEHGPNEVNPPAEGKPDEQAGKAPPWTWNTGAAPVDDAASEFFSSIKPIEIRLSIDVDRWNYLNEHALELDADSTFSPGEVSIDGAELGVVGIRPKGSRGTLGTCFNEAGEQICDKLSYKLKFNKYVDDKLFMGLSRLNLHSAVRDASFMRDFVAMGIYRRMGLPAPRVAFAELFVNDQLLGLYVLVEEIDEEFLKSRFPGESDGNLYKDRWPSGKRSGNLTSNLRTNEEDPEHSGFERFFEELSLADDAQLPSIMERWLDASRFDSLIAVDEAIGHTDGPLRFLALAEDHSFYKNHNFYLYQRSDELFEFIPWDTDRTFDSGMVRRVGPVFPRDLEINCEENATSPTDDPVWLRLEPNCEPLVRGLALSEHQGAMARLFDGPFSLPELESIVAWNQLRLKDAVDRDPTIEIDAWSSAVDKLLVEIHTRHELMLDP